MALLHRLGLSGDAVVLTVVTLGLVVVWATALQARTTVGLLTGASDPLTRFLSVLAVATCFPLLWWTLRGMEVGLLVLLSLVAVNATLRLARDEGQRPARRPDARCGGLPGHRHPIRLRGRRLRAGGLADAAPPEPATPPPGRRHRSGDRPHDRGDGGLSSRLLRRSRPQHVLPEARRLRPRGPAGPGSRGHRGHRCRLPGRPAGRRRPGSAPARARRPGRCPPAGAAGRAQRPVRHIRRRGRVGVLPDPEPVPHAEPRAPADPRRRRAPSGSVDRRRSRPASGGASPGSWCWPAAVRPWST